VLPVLEEIRSEGRLACVLGLLLWRHGSGSRD
jgi:hypothetical protein